MNLKPGHDRTRSVFHVLVILTISVQTVLSQCNGTTVVYTATDDYQVFTSLNYPNFYDNDLNCVWRIEADNNTDAIRMEVTDAGIEYHADCVYDYGEVFDGHNITAESMGKFCGNDNPSYVSSGHYMTVTFHSDYSLGAKGFKVRYKSGIRETLIDVEVDDQHISTLTILGASIGGIVLLTVIMTLVYTYIQAKKAKELRRNPMRRGLGVVQVEPFNYGGGWSYLDGSAPPAYGEIYSSPMSPPPQYSEVDPNPYPGAPLPGRSEFMPRSDSSNRRVSQGAVQSAAIRTDTNANTHFVITSSMRGAVTHINNYTTVSQTQGYNSANISRGNTVQNLNTALIPNRDARGVISSNASSVNTSNRTNCLPNATAPLSTESNQMAARNISSDNRIRTATVHSNDAVLVPTLSNNSSSTETGHGETVSPGDPEDTCSEIPLPSTRSVTMISDVPASGPVNVAS